MVERRVRRRDYRKLGLLGLLVFVAVFLFAFLAQRSGKIDNDANAANLAEFKPGYIISDFQMTNYTSMSEAEIQNWLTSKNSCNNNNQNYYLQLSRGSSYHWHFENGHFVCLSEEHFGDRDGEIGFQYPETAAHIIWQAAQDYRINPKVLLVLLQKETGLITDPVPNDWDYRRATGYGCPDTAACSEKYYGFKNQIRNAAALFRIVMDGNSSYYPIGNNNVRFSPDPACGSSVVYIENLATSALYRYTPYQPNAGALAAGYGTAPCGAYGNRNFFIYFQDWFGNILEEGWPSKQTLLSTNRVADESSDFSFSYKAHVEHYGWLDGAKGGAMIGTAGYGLRMEAFSLELGNNNKNIEYRAHTAYYGWLDWVKNGETAGTTGESLQMEAVEIKLTGEMAEMYDVYYRAHVAYDGWLDWVKNGETAGTTGEGKRMEALQVKLVRKPDSRSQKGIEYVAHTAYYGWLDPVKDGETAGTTGEGKRMEAIKINLPSELKGDIKYQAHVAYYGWLDPVKNGEVAGTTGEERRMEAIKIELTNGLEKTHDVYYRAHVAYYGWLDWVKNGEVAGTTGESLQMEAVEIKLVKK